MVVKAGHRQTASAPWRSRVGRGARALTMSASVDLSGDGGVIKRTLLAGNTTAARPSAGAVAVVHFIAWLSNGTEIGSTRRGAPLEIRLGCEPSEAVKGWELALPSMHPGEKALVTCTGPYAYGAAGAPPLIPPDATLAFELDLLSWRPSALRGGTAEGISRRWIDKLVDLASEGISMPTASANEMLHEIVQEENEASGRGGRGDEAGAPTVVEVLGFDDDAGADLRSLRDRGEALKAKAARGGRASGAGAAGRAGAEPELEVVGGGIVGEPIVQELYAKARGEGERHAWVEGRGDLEVSVPLPEGVGARSVSVSLERRWLQVRTPEFVLEGALVRDIDLEGSSWLVQPASADSGRSVYVLLVKRDPKQERWGAVFELDAPAASRAAPGARAAAVGPAADAVSIHYDMPRSKDALSG